jgi:streptogramin lyase
MELAVTRDPNMHWDCSRKGLLLVLAPILVCALLVGCSRTSPKVVNVTGPAVVGQVLDSNGKPVSAVEVTVQGPTMNAGAISVFTGADGSFATPVLGTNVDFGRLQIRLQKIGFEPQSEALPPSSDNVVRVNFKINATNNIASQVPYSAWIDTLPQDETRNMVVFRCAGCHQFPNPDGMAASLQHLSVHDREHVWHDVINRMRRMAFVLGPIDPEHVKYRWGLKAGSAKFIELTEPEKSLISPEQENQIAPYLAEHLPTDYTYMAPGTYHEVPTGTKGTVIKEYLLPDESGWVREVGVPRGSNYAYGIDLSRSQTVRVDRRTGEQTWAPVKGLKSDDTGPHTEVTDAEGNLWVSMDESQEIGRFTPSTGKWKVWGGFTKGALMHDFALNAKGELEPDIGGRIWITLIGMNRLASLNPETGEIKEYPLPVLPGQEPFRTALYGAAMASDRKHIWFSQLMGVLGEFNVETNKVETQVKFPLGTAPRRMAFDENDVLWVPLYGAGTLLEYDARARREIARYPLPDTAAAPYNLSYDYKRRLIWLGSANADRIFRFDIASKKFTQYPLPHHKTFLRMFALDKDSGEVWTTYAALPVGSGPKAIVMLKPGEPEEQP